MARLAPCFALALLACAPPRLPANEDESAEVGSEDEASEDTIDTTSTTTTTDTTSSSTEDGPDFVPVPDLPPEDCDPYSQNCPEGEKCVPYSSAGGNWDSFACLPVLGEVPPGGACHWDGIDEGTDDCDASSYCWDVLEVDGELIGRCAPMCSGTPDRPECPPGSSCLISGSGSLALCVSTCDPLLQDCALADGFQCHWVNNDFQCALSQGEAAAGEPCRDPRECAAGSTCLDAAALPECAGASCCAPFCELGERPDPCPAALPGTSCLAFFELGMAPPGYEQVGYCGLP